MERMVHRKMYIWVSPQGGLRIWAKQLTADLVSGSDRGTPNTGAVVELTVRLCSGSPVNCVPKLDRRVWQTYVMPNLWLQRARRDSLKTDAKQRSHIAAGNVCQRRRIPS